MRDPERTRADESRRIEDEGGNLRALDELGDLEVAADDPDVRGWDVRASDGRHIGEVKELLVDVDAMKVRYLDVELHPAFATRENERRVLVPIGEARLDEQSDEVRLGISSDRVAGVPGWNGRMPDREYETRVCMLYIEDSDTDRGAAADAGDFYGRPHFDETRFWGGRRDDRASTSWLRRRES